MKMTDLNVTTAVKQDTLPENAKKNLVEEEAEITEAEIEAEVIETDLNVTTVGNLATLLESAIIMEEEAAEVKVAVVDLSAITVESLVISRGNVTKEKERIEEMRTKSVIIVVNWDILLETVLNHPIRILTKPIDLV